MIVTELAEPLLGGFILSHRLLGLVQTEHFYAKTNQLQNKSEDEILPLLLAKQPK